MPKVEFIVDVVGVLPNPSFKKGETAELNEASTQHYLKRNQAVLVTSKPKGRPKKVKAEPQVEAPPKLKRKPPLGASTSGNVFDK